MSTFSVVTDIEAPVEACFDLARSIDLHLESMLASDERAIGGVTAGLIGHDEEVTWEARHFGVRWRMTSRIVEFDPARRFVDDMVRGPFSSFRHEHQFEPLGAGTRMTDVDENAERGDSVEGRGAFDLRARRSARMHTCHRGECSMWAQLIKTRMKEGSEEGLERLFQQLREAEQADSGLIRTLVMREQDDPNAVSMLVVFESEEKARARESDTRRNESLGAARATMAEIFDSPPSFTDFVVVAEHTP